MSLLQMSFSGAVIILLTVVLRAVWMNRLPKKTFLMLWWIALIRLLIPFSVKSSVSMYSLLWRCKDMFHPAGKPEAIVHFPVSRNTAAMTGALPGAVVQKAEDISVWMIVWLAGAILCMGFFVISYIKCCREFRFSLPVENDSLEEWKKNHPLRRRLSIRQTEAIAAPLSYGVIHPVILMPKHTEWENTPQLRCVLEHEYVHIRRFDLLAKLAVIAAVCIHWFNPLAWVMYILFNRDLEVSCDETVVRRFGTNMKAAYAKALISMEEKKSARTPLCSSFCKNAIEERIRAIMKIKKTSKFAGIISAVLVIGVAGGFATSAASPEKNAKMKGGAEAETVLEDAGASGHASDSEVEWWTAEEYEKWLEEEKEVLQSMIGGKAYTGSDGWFVWTQEKVDETIALYEEELQQIKEGMKLSKSVDGVQGVTMESSPDNTEQAEQEARTVTGDDDGSANFFAEEQLSEYEKFGITYQEETGALLYEGKTVGYFQDEFAPHTYTIKSCRDGELWIATERKNYGAVIGLKIEPLSEDFWSESEVLTEDSKKR